MSDLWIPNTTRRAFLRTAAIGGAACATAGLWLPQAVAQAAQPKKGGLFKLGLGGGSTTNSMNPGTWEDTFCFVGFSAIHNTLFEIAPDGSAQPELAESFEVSQDAKRWTLKLRQDVTFHNGKTLTAEDVVASIRPHFGKDSQSVAKALLGSLVDVRVREKDLIEFELSAGNLDFPYVLADYHLVILPSQNGIADWRSGVGAGAYRLKSFEPGVRMQMTKNPDYWKTNRGHFAEAEIIGITDGTARTNALMSGAVDVINNVDFKTVSLLSRNPNLVIEQTEGAFHYSFPMLCDDAQFKDNNVRLAVKHAVNRKALLDTALRGFGQVGNDHPIRASDRFFNQDLPQREYDPDKAKFYLRKAGQDSLHIRLIASDAAFLGAVDAAVLFKEQARAAGIEMDVVREPADGFWAKNWGKSPFITSFYYSSITPDRIFSLAYAKGAPWNETHWDNPRFNELLAASRIERDLALRHQIYNEMQQLCSDEGGALIPIFGNAVAARSRRVTHSGQLAPWGELDGLRPIERWWQA